MRCKKCGARLGGERLCSNCDYDMSETITDAQEAQAEAAAERAAEEGLDHE